MSLLDKNRRTDTQKPGLFDAEFYKVSWPEENLLDRYIGSECESIQGIRAATALGASRRDDGGVEYAAAGVMCTLITKTDLYAIGNEIKRLIHRRRELEKEITSLKNGSSKQQEKELVIRPPLGFGSGFYRFRDTPKQLFDQALVEEVPSLTRVEGIAVEDNSENQSLLGRYLLFQDVQFTRLCNAFSRTTRELKACKQGMRTLEREGKSSKFEKELELDSLKDKYEIQVERLENKVERLERELEKKDAKIDILMQAKQEASGYGDQSVDMSTEFLSIERHRVHTTNLISSTIAAEHQQVTSTHRTEIEDKHQDISEKVIEELHLVQQSVKCCAELKEAFDKTAVNIVQLKQEVVVCQRQNAELKEKLEKRPEGTRTLKHMKRVLHDINRRPGRRSGRRNDKSASVSLVPSARHRLCYRCRQKGHLAKDCPQGYISTKSEMPVTSATVRPPRTNVHIVIGDRWPRRSDTFDKTDVVEEKEDRWASIRQDSKPRRSENGSDTDDLMDRQLVLAEAGLLRPMLDVDTHIDVDEDSRRQLRGSDDPDSEAGADGQSTPTSFDVEGQHQPLDEVSDVNAPFPQAYEREDSASLIPRTETPIPEELPDAEEAFSSFIESHFTPGQTDLAIAVANSDNSSSRNDVVLAPPSIAAEDRHSHYQEDVDEEYEDVESETVLSEPWEDDFYE